MEDIVFLTLYPEVLPYSDWLIAETNNGDWLIACSPGETNNVSDVKILFSPKGDKTAEF